MDHMNPHNIPPAVSPAAMPNAMPNVMPKVMPQMMPHVNVLDIHQKTENIYMYPYAKPTPRPVYSDAALVLVLFILLVIISRGVHHFGKC